MIYSYELEKQLLAGLLKDPESLTEISNFIGTSDFYSESTSLNSTIFRIIEQAINANDEVDEVIIATGNILKTAKELKKYSIRREILE